MGRPLSGGRGGGGEELQAILDYKKIIIHVFSTSCGEWANVMFLLLGVAGDPR